MLGSSQSGENNIKRRREVCQRIAEPDTVVESLNTETMPDLVIPRIGNFIDEYLCAVQVFKIVAREQKNFDGIVIAGFADTGLDGAREIAEIPILGIAETSYLVAALLAHKFSVLTSTKQWTLPKERRLRTLGLDSRVASIRPFSFSNDEERVSVCADLVKKCVEEDGAEAVVLGGGGFGGWGQPISERAGNICPVIDPVCTTFKVMEGLLSVGLRHSKAGMWESYIPTMLGTRKYVRPFKV